MREILFRGKAKNDGEWLCGHYTEYAGVGQIWVDTDNGKHNYLVDIDTVGEYTGVPDKNGRNVFENDVFQLDDECIGVVIFKDGSFRLQVWGMCGTYTESGYDECGGGWGITECEPIDWYYIRDMEVIGNVHDNPELLEGTQK